MVCHEAEGMADPIVAFDHLGQHTQEVLPIVVVFENRLAPIASGSDVVESTGKFDTQGSGHIQSLAHHRK